MPRATVNIAETQRFDLESCPEGFVVLRKMSYGQVLQRQEMAMQMQMQAQRGKGSDGAARMDIKNMHQEVAVFDFKTCIVEHNLEDDGGRLLDFRVGASTVLL